MPTVPAEKPSAVDTAQPDVVGAVDAVWTGQHHGINLATLVMRRQVVIAERYGIQPDTMFGPGAPVDATTPLISWSMAKSITHAIIGALVVDGLIEVDEPARVAAWQGTEKASITVQHLLDMTSGLDFIESYDEASVSHCIDMLYGEGRADMAAYAAARPLAHPPGTVWNYSSGNTNILCRIAADILAPGAVDGGRQAVTDYVDARVFAPSGMTTATATFDDAGTMIGSSFVHAAAVDFARFGDAYRRSLLGPADWTNHAATVVAHDETFDYGRHWWVWREYPGVFAAHGYEGQFTIVVPDAEAVVVHLGKCPIDHRPILLDKLRAVIESVRRIG